MGAVGLSLGDRRTRRRDSVSPRSPSVAGRRRCCLSVSSTSLSGLSAMAGVSDRPNFRIPSESLSVCSPIAMIACPRGSPSPSGAGCPGGTCSARRIATWRSVAYFRTGSRRVDTRSLSPPDARDGKRVDRRPQGNLVWPDALLKVVRRKSGPCRDTCQHPGADLLPIMKREHEIRPTLAFQHSMGSGRSFDSPTDSLERRQEASGAYASPLAHAALKLMLNRSGPASPCSKRSATTRSASA